MKWMRLATIVLVGLGLCAAQLACGCSEQKGLEPEPKAYPALDHFPAWSPAGSAILYYHVGIVEISEQGPYRIDPDSAGLWLVSVDGTDPRIVLRSGPVYGDWAPDGEWIVFETDAQIYKARLATGQVDTASVVQLTSGSRNFFPSWSPDGEWIAYDSDLSDPQAPYEIWKMHADGTGKTNVSLHSARMPDWSPDGTRLVHRRYVGANGEIFTMDASGASLVQLTSGVNRVEFPRYSPDGTKILFQSGNEIWVMDSDGANPHRVITGSEASWSPDGRSIAFVRLTSDLSTNGTVWVMDIDHSNLRQVTPGFH